MGRGQINLSVTNSDEFENAMGREYPENVQATLLDESKSGKFFICEMNAHYAVFEKSPDETFDGTVCCSFKGCQSVGPEDDECLVRDTLWREGSGCVRLMFYDWLTELSDSICVVWDKELYEAKERRFRSQNGNTRFLARKKTARSLLGKTVEIEIDRPIGYVHRKGSYMLTYPVNYGFVPGVLGGDGEELDVYLLGVSEPIERFKARVVGVVHRENDCEDKLVAVPEGVTLTKEEIASQTEFQEQYYDTFIETEGSLFECSMCDCAFDRKIPAELEHLLLKKIIFYLRDNTFGIYSAKEFNGYLESLKSAGKSDEYIREVSEKSEYVVNPRTLFTAVWREYRRQGYEIGPDEKTDMKFYFNGNGLFVEVSRKTE